MINPFIAGTGERQVSEDEQSISTEIPLAASWCSKAADVVSEGEQEVTAQDGCLIILYIVFTGYAANADILVEQIVYG